MFLSLLTFVAVGRSALPRGIPPRIDVFLLAYAFVALPSLPYVSFFIRWLISCKLSSALKCLKCCLGSAFVSLSIGI